MRILPLAAALLLVAACEREDRAFRADPAATETPERIALSSLSPGLGGPSEHRTGQGERYEGNAYHLSEGKRLYKWFNCNGCHANGGGDSGPPLMDDRWIYGGRIENVVQTIREGRPNGMPSFRTKIPDEQIWQLAAYVRSMSGQAPKDAAPNRDDDMHNGPAEMRRDRSPMTPGGMVPSSSERPE